jgi:hypothetical protein
VIDVDVAVDDADVVIVDDAELAQPTRIKLLTNKIAISTINTLFIFPSFNTYYYE